MTDAPDQESGNCCRIGLALAIGSAFVAVGGLLRSGAPTLLVVGFLGALAALLSYFLAGRWRSRVEDSSTPDARARPAADRKQSALPSQAVELGRMKDTFLSTISHELRTPLTNICAYTEILLHLVPGDEAEWPEFLRIVQNESQRLTRLVDSVMDYVRLENDEVNFVLEQVDIGEIAKHAVDLCALRADSRDIDLSVDVEQGMPSLSSDAARLTQVFVHLLDNALKFTPGGGRVQVSVLQEGGQAVVQVDDSGPGIRPELRERAFEKFSQLRDHLSSKPEGTGLGLATVRLLLERLSGTIVCEESPLGGARFRCRLPVGSPSPDDVPAPPGSGDARQEVPTG